MRRLLGLGPLLVGSVFLASSAFGGTVSSPQPLVPAGSYLAATESGRLIVLSPSGTLLRQGPQFAGCCQGLALSPDRQSVYVSDWVADQPPQLYEVALDSGTRTLIAGSAISPALSPDGTELAYLTVDLQNTWEVVSALVIRNLQTGTLRTIPFPPGVPVGTPPELIINWSPHGHSIALFDGTGIRIVDVASAETVESQPSYRNAGRALAPVFLAPHTLVVMPYCCASPQQLLAIRVHSGRTADFARVSDPVENVRWVRRRTLLAVTAVHQLVRVSEGRRARVVTRMKIVAATP